MTDVFLHLFFWVMTKIIIRSLYTGVQRKEQTRPDKLTFPRSVRERLCPVYNLSYRARSS